MTNTTLSAQLITFDLLGVTILLSLTIFLNTVSSIIPITSDSPLVGKAIINNDQAFLRPLNRFRINFSDCV